MSFMRYEAGNDGNNNGDDEDDNFNLHDARGNRDHLLFLVDCSLEMWQDGRDYPIEILKTVVEAYKTRAVSGNKDFIALMLYGTREYKNESHEEHIVLFNHMQLPNASDILGLLDLIRGGRRAFMAKYGSVSRDQLFKMSDVFWEAQRAFPANKYNVGIRRVLMFTNDDNPHGRAGDEITLKRRLAAQSRLRDLQAQNISVEVFGSSPFDYQKFYSEVLGLGEDGVERSFKSYKSQVELEKMVRKRQFGKRSLSKLMFQLAEGVEIGVSLYGLINETKKPAFSYRDSATLDVVVPQTTWQRSDNQQQVALRDPQLQQHQQQSSRTIMAGKKPLDLKGKGKDFNSASSAAIADASSRGNVALPAFKYAGTLIPFQQEEVGQIRNIFPTGIKLLCFKDKRALHVDYNVKPSYFIYPDESLVKGSVQLFSALLQTTYEQERIAICRFVPRAGSAVRLGALLPQIEIRDEDGSQEQPPGFHVILLPMADDIRSVPESPPIRSIVETKSEVTPPVVDIMSAIIRKLTAKVPFSPLNFPNPVLQRHYSVIEALALELDQPYETVDALQPPVGQLLKCKDLFDKLNDKLIPDLMDVDGEVEPHSTAYASGSKKRRRMPAQSQKGAKKVKNNDDDTDESLKSGDGKDLEEWRQRREKGDLKQMNVKELKSFLTSVRVKPVGKKSDLIEQINSFFRNN